MLASKKYIDLDIQSKYEFLTMDMLWKYYMKASQRNGRKYKWR